MCLHFFNMAPSYVLSMKKEEQAFIYASIKIKAEKEKEYFKRFKNKKGS